MICGRNVFLKYGLGAKRLSEIWFGCETSFWNMVWVRNVFLSYEDGGETSFLFMGRGRNVFPKYELGAKRPTKKWCELTMGRNVCVPTIAATELSEISRSLLLALQWRKEDVFCRQFRLIHTLCIFVDLLELFYVFPNNKWDGNLHNFMLFYY